MKKPLEYKEENLYNIILSIKQAGSIGCKEIPHTPTIHALWADLTDDDGNIDHFTAYSYYIAAFYVAESRWPKMEEMGEEVDENIYARILQCAYSIFQGCYNSTSLDAPLLLRNDNSIEFISPAEIDADIRNLASDIKHHGLAIECYDVEDRLNSSLNKLIRGGFEPMVRFCDAKEVITEKLKGILSLESDVYNRDKKIEELEKSIEKAEADHKAAIAQTIVEQEEKARGEVENAKRQIYCSTIEEARRFVKNHGNSDLIISAFLHKALPPEYSEVINSISDATEERWEELLSKFKYIIQNNMKYNNCNIGILNEGGSTMYVGDNVAKEYAPKATSNNNADTKEIIKTSLETIVKMKAPDGGAMITNGTQLEAVRCVANEVLGIKLSKKVFATSIEQMNIVGLPNVNIYTAIASVDEKFASTPIGEWINNTKLTDQKSFTKQHSVAIAFKQELEKTIRSFDATLD